jgi:hypothetical protein
MADQLTIEIFGLLHGAAEGPLAISALVLIALAVTRPLWWRSDDGGPTVGTRMRAPTPGATTIRERTSKLWQAIKDGN